VNSIPSPLGLVHPDRHVQYSPTGATAQLSRKLVLHSTNLGRRLVAHQDNIRVGLREHFSRPGERVESPGEEHDLAPTVIFAGGCI